MVLKIVAFMLVLVSFSAAQDRSNERWYFGAKQGLDFSSSPPRVLTDGMSSHDEGCAVACHPYSGALLFYTDGNTVWNRNHMEMERGINPKYSSSAQSALILRQPGSLRYYHLFTTTVQGRESGRHFIIDMALNGGLGKIVKRDTNFTQLRVSEKLSATAAANGRDYWVLFRKTGQANAGFLAYMLSSAGLNTTPVLSAVGKELDKTYGVFSSQGCMSVSPDGKTIASANYGEDIEIFDFDNKAGKVSNVRTLTFNTEHYGYGLAFSASGKYLYANYLVQNPRDTIVRFNVRSQNIAATREFVGQSKSGFFGQLCLAPDGKMYVATLFRKCLAAISYPDSSNPVFSDSAIALPGLSTLGLPNWVPVVDNAVAAGVTTLISSEYACLGGTITYTITSKIGDSLIAEVLFEDGSTRIITGRDSILQFRRLIAKKQYYIVRAIVRSGDNPNSGLRDTVRIQTNAFYDCCSNVVRNGNFYAVATGGQCFTVEYTTDMDFRASLSSNCPYVVSQPGQLSSEGSAAYGNRNWEGMSHSTVGGFLLYGETVPNLPQRAWIQSVPVWKNRQYLFQAFVKNTEKIPRFDTTGCSLRFALVASQNGRVDTVAVLQNVAYRDGWLSLGGNYQPQADDQVELAIVVQCISKSANSFGFGIDDIQFTAIPYLNIDAGVDTIVCRGKSQQISARVQGGVSVRWTPAAGLSNDTILQPLFDAAQSRVYHLTVYDTNGCVAQDSVYLEVVDPETLSIQAQKNELCPGDSVQLRVDEGFQSVRWSTGDSGPSVRITQPGSYYAEAIDKHGCQVFSDTVRIREAERISASLVLPDSFNISAGKVFYLPLVLQADKRLLKGASFIAYGRCRSSVLLPKIPLQVSGRDQDWTLFEVSGEVTESDTLSFLKFTALLSVDRMSEVIIDSLWLNRSCTIDVQKHPGAVYIQACWVGGGVVLLESKGTLLGLYPNPADEQVIALIGGELGAELYVELYDAIGVLEKRQKVIRSSSSDPLVISLEGLASGAHTVVLHCDGVMSRGRVIKR